MLYHSFIGVKYYNIPSYFFRIYLNGWIYDNALPSFVEVVLSSGRQPSYLQKVW